MTTMFKTEPIGAPGVYVRHRSDARQLQAERMDTCAFAGIAPRGPCREPRLPDGWRNQHGPFMRQWRAGAFDTRRTIAVPVESFEEYTRLYGGRDGPGRLPYAVKAFFDQGGRRAWVMRIVHKYADDAGNRGGVAKGQLQHFVTTTGGAIEFEARNEGAWGNRLRVALGLQASPVVFRSIDTDGLVLEPTENPPAGSLLRLMLPGDIPLLRFVADVREAVIDGRSQLRVSYDTPAPVPAQSVDILTGELIVDDGGSYREVFNDLGLSARHPRWLAGVLCHESALVYPLEDWCDAELKPRDIESLSVKPVLPPSVQAQFTGGEDRFGDLVHEDFFDAAWSVANDEAGDGIHAIATNPEVASLSAVDLYCPSALPDILTEEPAALFAGPEFAPCINQQPSAEPELVSPAVDQMCLDPRSPADREIIIVLQQRLVAFADAQASWIALLDVPPGLRNRQILNWRARFSSSYAAAYMPWLKVMDNNRQTAVTVNPSAFAAGILAAREIKFGVPFGPANELARGVVASAEPVSTQDHDALHPHGINVFMTDADGYRLSAARTLSSDPRVRQLSVRRLMILLKRVLHRQMQWAVFEPNGLRLWREITRMLEGFLGRLYSAGAFTGATPAEAFFVRCDNHTNPSHARDQGRVIAEIGVAPAEPMEFIVLRLTLDNHDLVVREG